jgi:hypothetical protein
MREKNRGGRRKTWQILKLVNLDVCQPEVLNTILEILKHSVSVEFYFKLEKILKTQHVDKDYCLFLRLLGL